MNRKRVELHPVIFSLLASTALASAADTESPTLQQTILLPGVTGRFDHAASDPTTHRLFFAALGNDTLEIVDTSAGKHLHSLTGLRKPTGVLFLAGANLLVIANGADGTCRFYDGTTYAEKGRVTEVDDADNLRYDEKSNVIYLGYGDGMIGKIDPATMKLVGHIALPHHPEAFQLEQNGPRIFINIPEARQVVVADRLHEKVIATWPLNAVGGNFPMALDEAHQRLFIGCRSPARLVVMSLIDGHLLSDIALSQDTDDLFYVASSQRLHASCGEGFLDSFDAPLEGPLSHVGHSTTRSGARTSFFIPIVHQLYLAVPQREGHDAELRGYSFPKPVQP